MSTVYCQECGTANDSGAGFCGNCGTKIEGPAKPAASQGYQSQSSGYQPPQETQQGYQSQQPQQGYQPQSGYQSQQPQQGYQSQNSGYQQGYQSSNVPTGYQGGVPGSYQKPRKDPGLAYVGSIFLPGFSYFQTEEVGVGIVATILTWIMWSFFIGFFIHIYLFATSGGRVREFNRRNGYPE